MGKIKIDPNPIELEDGCKIKMALHVEWIGEKPPAVPREALAQLVREIETALDGRMCDDPIKRQVALFPVKHELIK